jgi:hypothetical protein
LAISTVLTFRIPPGRRAEGLKALAKTRTLHEAVGAQVRVWSTLFGGSDSLQVVYIAEYADFADYQHKREKMPAHPLAEAIEAGTLISVSNAILTEIEARQEG